MTEQEAKSWCEAYQDYTVGTEKTICFHTSTNTKHIIVEDVEYCDYTIYENWIEAYKTEVENFRKETENDRKNNTNDLNGSSKTSWRQIKNNT